MAAWNEDPEGVDGEVKQDEPSGHLLRVKRTLKKKTNYFRPNQEQLRSDLSSCAPGGDLKSQEIVNFVLRDPAA